MRFILPYCLYHKEERETPREKLRGGRQNYTIRNFINSTFHGFIKGTPKLNFRQVTPSKSPFLEKLIYPEPLNKSALVTVR